MAHHHTLATKQAPDGRAGNPARLRCPVIIPISAIRSIHKGRSVLIPSQQVPAMECLRSLANRHFQVKIHRYQASHLYHAEILWIEPRHFQASRLCLILSQHRLEGCTRWVVGRRCQVNRPYQAKHLLLEALPLLKWVIRLCQGQEEAARHIQFPT
jgi:hypothetical protein